MEVRNVVLRKFARHVQGILALLLLSMPVQGSVQTGYVYTRAPVLNPDTGAEIWGEYDPQTGAYVRDIADATGQYDPQLVMVLSGEQFQAYKRQYEDLKETFTPESGNLGKFLYSRAEFLAASFTTVGGEPIDNSAKSRLKSSTTHVAVRPRELLYINDPDQLVLAEFPVNPEAFVSLSTLSLLINDQGEPLYQSQNRIGIKAAFLSDASGSVINPDKNQNRKHDDQIHGPIAGVEIEGHVLSRTITDSEGRYVLQWADIPCPLVAYFMDGYATARLESRRFNPRMQSTPYPYYLMKPYSISCIPNVYMVPFLGPWPIDMGTVTVTPLKLDFTVDTVVLSGTAHLADSEGNLIPVEEKTRYKSENQELQTTISDFYDFDGDGTNDTVVKGYWLEETDPATGALTKKFEIAGGDTNGKELLQGVYLSSNKREPGKDAPDFTRLMDWQTNFSHEGLVAAISEEDLRNTDLYVFRLSDGKLISERLGLAANDGTWSDELGASDQNSRFYYHTYLRGYSGDLYRYTQGGFVSEPTFANWQAKSGINPELHQRQSDHLKPGDLVEIVAINRATGYMGSVQTTVKAAGSDGLGRSLSWDIDEIKLLPPNLKIWVERDYDIKAGLEKGAIREDQIIGYEGAALSDDRAIVIYTDWRKPDGTPLPVMENGNEADYGYTGRIAYLSADKTVAADGSYGIAHFAIKPGKHMQVLRLPDGADSKHLYIQVSGEPESGRPIFTNFSQSKTANFESTGVHEGKLEPRPDRFVPFLVPVFDEENTETQRQIYRQLKRDNPEVSYQKPKPVYRWQYRPEFQYSIYGLNIQELTLHAEDKSEGTDLLNSQTPVISSSDDLIALVYNLDIINYLPLDYFNSGEEKELIFAFGEHEVKAKINERDRIEFTDLAHLASLDPEDFLTIQLYTNNDTGNVLWEYAFEYLLLDTQFAAYDSSAGEPLYVSADDPVVPLQALLLGYANRDAAIKEPIRVLWSATGGAALQTTSETNSELGAFFNEVTLPTQAGSSSTVSIKLMGVEDSTVSLPPIEVVPGKSARITPSSDQQKISVDGIGQTTLTFAVHDQHGNPVKGVGVGFYVEDSLHVVIADTATNDQGVAQVTVKAGPHSGPANVKFQIEDQSETVAVVINPLTIEIVTDGTVLAGATETFEVRVTDIDGQPVAGVEVMLGSTYGYIRDPEVTTGTDGRAITTLTAPGSDGRGVVTAQIGRSSPVQADIEVVYPSMTLRDLEVNHAAVIGDVGTAGSINHQRYDGTPISVPYKVQETIKALGQEGDRVTVKIGDMRDPNLAPLAAYYMNMVDGNLVIDDTGRYSLNSHNVTQANGTPLGGGTSLRFSADNDLSEPGNQQSSVLWADDVPLLGRPNNIGLSIDVYPTGTRTGTLVDLGQGAQVLAFNANGELVYQIRTSEGTYTLNAGALFSGQWHRIAARYYNGQAELWVNGKLYTTSVSGDLQYRWTGYSDLERLNPELDHDLVIGKGFSGQLNSLKWFNWSGQPLLTFADGGTESTVTIGPDGYTDLILVSTGRMNDGGSQLPLQRIAVHTDLVRQYASLLSTSAFSQLAGQYVDTLATDTPPLNLAGLYPRHDLYGNAHFGASSSPVVDFLIPRAHASGSSSFVWGLINWVIPLESFGILFQQLSYLVTDPNKFEADEFVIALVDAITIFPPAKGLKLFTTPLKAMTRALKGVNPKFMKHFGGYLNRVMQKAKKGDFDTLWNTLPFLVIAAEMYNDEEARQGLEFLMSTVDSADDIVAWVDYLALPVGGWLGDGAPPAVDTFGEDADNASLLSFFISQAHAAPRARRISGKAIGQVLASLKKHMGSELAKDLPDALKVVREALQRASVKDLRKYAHSKEMMQVSAGMMARAGARSLRNFVTGRTNMRYHPAAVVAFLSYLEYENSCGRALDNEAKLPVEGAPGPKESELLNCKETGFDSSTRRTVYSKIATAFADTIDSKLTEKKPGAGDRATLMGGGHGALFHLEQLAFYQGMYRAGLGPKVKEVEGFRYVAFFRDVGDLPAANKAEFLLNRDVLRRIRYVDIVLETGPNQEKWIELKSYKAKSEANRKELDFGKIGRWELAKQGGDKRGTAKEDSSLHRQFVLDRVARNEGVAWLAKNRSESNQINKLVNVTDFQWRFQKFKVEKRSPSYKAISPDLGSESDKKSIRGILAEIPSPGAFGKDVIDVSLNPNGGLRMNDVVVDSGINSTIKTVLPGLGFKLVEEALEEFVLD